MPYFIFLMSLLFILPAVAEEEIEEVAPFEDPVKKVDSTKAVKNYRYTAYLLGESLQRHNTLLGDDEQNVVEAAFSGNWAKAQFKLFADLRSVYTFEESNQFSFKQLGLRYTRGNYLFTLGMDRNLKTPGLLISPADFLYRNSTLPGAREQTQGVWLARAAYLRDKSSVEFTYLLNMEIDEYGFPKLGHSTDGIYTSYFQQGKKVDMALNFSRLDERNNVGGFVQGFIYKFTKLYMEYAHKEYSNFEDDELLLGISFEGLDKLSARAEWFYQKKMKALVPPANAQNLSALFFLTHYAIFGVNASDLWRQSSISFNHIRGKDDQLRLWLLRGEIPFGGKVRLGGSLSYVKNTLANIEQSLVGLDLRYSF